jgi:DNA-binding CsgD family transcriptional regulator
VPLVGRRAELALLRAALDRADSGAAGCVLLAGDAGVGKTRLIGELREHAEQRGALVLSGGCIDIAEDSLPYLPFADALLPLARSDDPAVRAVVQAYPALRRLLPQQDDGGKGAVEHEMRRGLFSAQDLGQLQLFEAVLGALGELSRERPVVLVIEDLHWADSSTRDLLSFLLPRLREQRLLIVASYRADDVHRRHPLRRLTAEFARLPAVQRVDLAPLEDADALQFVHQLAEQPLTDEVAAGIVERAEGNPFFMEELTASCLECEGVPAALADVLLSRVERLSQRAQQVVRILSVAERGARHQALAEVTGLSDDELDAALREAVQHNILVVDDDNHYAFRHALLREAVYEDLLPGERIRTHAAYAQRLVQKVQQGNPAKYRLLAYHSLESNDLPTALSASVAAADEAEARGAPASALRSVELALRLWDSVPPDKRPDGVDELRLLDMAAVLAGRSGEVERAISYARSMVRALESGRIEVSDHRRRARIYRRLAQALYSNDGTVWEAPDVIEKAWRLVADDEPSETKAWVQVTRSAIQRSLGDKELALASARNAIADAKAVGAVAAEADALVALAVLIEGKGDTAGSRERLREALRIAERAGALGVELRARFYLALSYYDKGELDEALAEYTAGAARATETGLTWSDSGLELHAHRLQVMYTLGRWDEVAAEVARFSGPPSIGAARMRATTALVAVAKGDFAEAERQVEDLRAQWQVDGQLAVAAAAAGAALAMWKGEPEKALERVREAFEWIRQLPLLVLAGIRIGALGLAAAADRAEAARLISDADTVAAAVAEGEEMFKRVAEAAQNGVPRGNTLGPEAVAWLARAEAERSRLLGRTDPKLWAKAVEAFGYGAVYQQASCRWRLAEALLTGGDARQAEKELRQAHETARTLKARPLLEAIEGLARRARVSLDGEAVAQAPARVPEDPLTARERAVLEQVALGRTNKQIGEALFISEKTVSVHLSRAMAKLGARRRTEAVRLAYERGLLQRPRHGAPQ